MHASKQKTRISEWVGHVGAIVIATMLFGTALISVSDAGIGRYGLYGGRIGGFGSIFVNDREFDISGASITINGQAASEIELHLGQSVFLTGDADDELPVGTALQIQVDSPLKGRVTEIDKDEKRLTVLSHIVNTDPATILVRQSGGNNFDDFQIGDVVEVDGLVGVNGDLVASRIAQLNQPGESRIKGVVSAVIGFQFEVDALSVDFENAMLSGFPTGVVSSGDAVRIHGIANAAGTELIASKLELTIPIQGELDDVGEFEGLVSSFTSSTEFSVGGIRVATNEDTGFIGGGPANLAADVKLVVRGQFDSWGSLVADEVTIRGTRIRIYGRSDLANAAELQVLGVPLVAVATTEFKDASDADIDPFGLDDINAGDYIEARSFRNPLSTTPVISARIERDDSEESALLQGFIGATGAQDFEVLGVVVLTSTETEFTDANDVEISSAEFFDAISGGNAAGTFVKVRGTSATATYISATEVSLQIHD